MSLTVQAAAEYVQHRLGGDPSVPMVTLCNQAGDHLAGMHDWQWLSRPPALMSLTISQTYITLPSDFGRAIDIKSADTSTLIGFEFVSAERLAELRATISTIGGYTYYGAILNAISASNVVAPRLEIWPTPGATQSNVFALYYLASFKAVAKDNDLIVIPSWLEAFYLEVLFAFAQGYEEHDVGARGARLDALEASSEFLKLKRRDGSVQPSIGFWQGGAVQMQKGRRAAIGIAVRALDPT